MTTRNKTFYDGELAKIKVALENPKLYKSKQTDEMRGINDYHVRAIMKAITPILIESFDSIYEEGFQDGGL